MRDFLEMISNNVLEIAVFAVVLTTCAILFIAAVKARGDESSCITQCKNGTVHVTVETDTEKKVIDTGMRCDK